MINDYLKICLKYNLNYCPHVQKFDIEKNLSDDKIFDLFHSYQFYSLKLNFHEKGFCIKKKLKKKNAAYTLASQFNDLLYRLQ